MAWPPLSQAGFKTCCLVISKTTRQDITTAAWLSSPLALSFQVLAVRLSSDCGGRALCHSPVQRAHCSPLHG